VVTVRILSAGEHTILSDVEADVFDNVVDPLLRRSSCLTPGTISQ
jgi:hypothetical protein